MSKQGVQLTQEHRKPRRRVKLEEHNGVVGKECTKCGEWKALNTSYNNQKTGLGGKSSQCRLCCRKYYNENASKICEQVRKYRQENADKVRDGQRKYYEDNADRLNEKRREKYSSNPDKILARHKEWRAANLDKDRARHKEYRRKNVVKVREAKHRYYEANSEKIKERNSHYKRLNREIYNISGQRRKARKDSLPSNLASEQYAVTTAHFINSCAITKQTQNLEMEHALPISIGHGGTTFGNCYPMASTLNNSKHNHNIFEWFDANRQRFELSRSRFDALIGYLARANALTISEYRDFVYWCHANPRTVDEIKADQRHSIEIWREASGQQFPLPAYTETYNSASTDESQAV